MTAKIYPFFVKEENIQHGRKHENPQTQKEKVSENLLMTHMCTIDTHISIKTHETHLCTVCTTLCEV